MSPASFRSYLVRTNVAEPLDLDSPSEEVRWKQLLRGPQAKTPQLDASYLPVSITRVPGGFEVTLGNEVVVHAGSTNDFIGVDSFAALLRKNGITAPLHVPGDSLARQKQWNQILTEARKEERV
jgi:hypothetical protein